MGNRSREGLHWICAPAPSFLSPIFAPQGDTGWGFSGDCLGLVMDLQVGGMLYVIFSPSVAPYTIHSFPLLSFQVTQSLHCTQGVVITGAAEIGQDKGTLPAQDVFPLSFLFSSSFFPLLSCFPFSSHVLQFFLLLIFVAHFSLMFLPYWPISFSIYLVLCQSMVISKMEKQVTPLPSYRVCSLP